MTNDPPIEDLKRTLAEQLQVDILERLDQDPVSFTEWLADRMYQDCCRVADAAYRSANAETA